jgi:hypothetical protein
MKHTDIAGLEHKEISMSRLHEVELNSEEFARNQRNKAIEKANNYYEGYIAGLNEICNLLNHCNIDYKGVE